MTEHRIGISYDPDEPGERFEQLDLHVHLGPDTGRRRWFRTPIAGAGFQGSTRVGSLGVAWGHGDAILRFLPDMPEPAILVVSPDPRPDDGLDPRVIWIVPAPGDVLIARVRCVAGDDETVVEVVVESAPGPR